MKNSQKGFIVPVLLVIIALLVIGGGVYVYENKKTEAPVVVDTTNQQQTNTQTPPVQNTQTPTTQSPKVPTTQPSDSATPYIGSITPWSAPIGTIIEIRGSGLVGFEGDVYFFFKRSDGKIARLPGVVSTQTTGDAKGAQTARVVVKEPCQQGQTVYGDYSGIPAQCDYVQLTPGIYRVYTTPWGKKSNEVQFTITQSGTSELNSFTHYDSGITFKYPKDWKFDSAKNYFTTSDYQEGQSGARIEFIYGLSGNDWQGTVAAMYGSKSVNTQTSVNGKVALRTTYPSDDHLIALSLPFANNTAFVSLLLKYQAPGRLSASYKDSYEPILQSIAENAVLPSGTANAWNTYVNNTYNFSFSHPPLTAVISDGTYFKNSVASYLAMVRYGFHQLLFVFTKPTDQSLKTWYDGTFAGMSPARGPVEKTINSYSAIDVTFNDMDTAGRHIMVSKNGVVVDFLFSNATVDSPLTADQQKLLDSFLFLK